MSEVAKLLKYVVVGFAVVAGTIIIAPVGIPVMICYIFGKLIFEGNEVDEW